jgi:CD2 antigen cytoplasmic tail-binding protein 2
MKDELDEGRFSADGSYIANDLDPNAAHDSWLGGISKIAMKAAKESKKRMEEADRAREEKETKGDGAMAGERDDCFLGLLEMVREGETVAGALARLGKQKAALSSKVTPSSDSMDLDSAPVPSSTAPTVASISARILRLTHLSSTLLSTHGELEIYDATHASIIALLRSEGAVRRDWIPPVDPSIAEEYLEEAKAKVALASTASSSSGPINRTRALISRPVSTTTNGGGGAGGTFYYKWVVTPAGGEEGKEYGPFGRAEVQGWVGQGYFGSGGEAVVVRKEGGSAWSTWREASA